MSKSIQVKSREIRVKLFENQEFLCITDMLQEKEGDFFISDWLRNRNTLELLGIWEQLHNEDFNYGEFALIKQNFLKNSSLLEGGEEQ